MRRAFFCVAMGMMQLCAAADEPTGAFPPPKSVRESLASMHLRPGFQIDLVAAEPLVMDPVAFDWGPAGKLWVVEMADYPLGLDDRGKPGGRVRFLEDRDNDGRYETSTLFLDGIAYPNGVFAWRDGVLISAAPEILFAQDTDGDGKCDVRKTLFTGFSESNPQHRMNGFSWGLDNWLYCGGDHHQGEIMSLLAGKKAAIGRRDFRIRPDDGQIAPVTGQTQFVRTRDDWGNWFGSTNSNPGFHFALVDRYLQRNPYLRPPTALVQLSNVPGAAPVYPTSRTVARFNDYNKVNRFTSACGLVIYRDDFFGEGYYGNTFVCEPVHNLVHREVVSPAGYTFSSRRAPDEAASEFLSSSDNWCRPVTARTGPDGALWVADMYRMVIEHPEWIPDVWIQRLDLRAGHDKGRIYRIYPQGKTLRPIPRTANMTTDALVASLESPNGTHRDMAHEMLVWRKDLAAVPGLSTLVSEGVLPAARLQALGVLDGLGALNDDVLLAALKDKHPGVRRGAIRFGEARVASNQQLAEAALKLVDDPDPQVQMQLAYSLGEWSNPSSGRALGALLSRAKPKSYLYAAALSSLLPHLDTAARTVLSSDTMPSAELVAELLAAAVVEKHDATVTWILASLTEDSLDTRSARTPAWRMNALSGLLIGLQRRRVSLENYRRRARGELSSALTKLDEALAVARRIVADDKSPVEDRLAALELIKHDRSQETQQVASQLLGPQTPFVVQSAGVAVLSRFDNAATPDLLLAQWSSYGPQLRSEVLSALFGRTEWQRRLLDAVEKSKVSRNDLDASRRQQLQQHRDATLRQRANQLFAGASSTTRQQVLENYQSVHSLTGEPERGAATFKKTCANCHRLGEMGYVVGPDLTALTDKSVTAMLVAILDPNRAVESKYVGFTAVDVEGRVQTGLLTSETGSAIELLAEEGKRHAILRGELEVLQSSGKSLMPEGMEKDLKPQDISDVVAYLASQSDPRKVLPGNQPRVVQADALRGEFWLLPQKCEVYGATLNLESPYGNLGNWRSENDRAVWTIQVEKGGKFRLSLEYSCTPDAAGNQCITDVAGQRVVATIQSTGSADAYREFGVGRVELTAGRHRVAVRAAGGLRGELADLKTVRLRPE